MSVPRVTEYDVTLVTVEVVTRVTSRSIDLGELERVGTRRARPTVERVLDHEDLRHLSRTLERLQDERVRLGVVLADAAPAEAAHPDRRSPAGEAVHVPPRPLVRLMLPDAIGCDDRIQR